MGGGGGGVVVGGSGGDGWVGDGKRMNALGLLGPELDVPGFQRGMGLGTLCPDGSVVVVVGSERPFFDNLFDHVFIDFNDFRSPFG